MDPVVEFQKSPSHKKAFVLALVSVILVSCVYLLLSNSRKVTLEPTREELISEQKKVVIERLQKVDTQPLTQKEKAETLNFVSRGGARYTEAEKAMITKILRAQ